MIDCSKEKLINSEIMVREKQRSVKVNVEVPIDEYRLLQRIKEETGKSIRGLAREGIPLIILKHADLIEERKKNVLSELDEMGSTLASLKKFSD